MEKEPNINHIPEQELQKYNREPGKKTLYFVGGLIVVIVVLTILILTQIH